MSLHGQFYGARHCSDCQRNRNELKTCWPQGGRGNGQGETSTGQYAAKQKKSPIIHCWKNADQNGKGRKSTMYTPPKPNSYITSSPEAPPATPYELKTGSSSLDQAESNPPLLPGYVAPAKLKEEVRVPSLMNGLSDNPIAHLLLGGLFCVTMFAVLSTGHTSKIREHSSSPYVVPQKDVDNLYRQIRDAGGSPGMSHAAT